MADEQRSTLRGHEQSPHILSAAATLSGTCLALVGLLRLEQAARGVVHVADNVLAGSALGFLAATLLAYVAVRKRSFRFHSAAEVAFGLGLVLLALVLLALVFDVIPVQ